MVRGERRSIQRGLSSRRRQPGTVHHRTLLGVFDEARRQVRGVPGLPCAVAGAESIAGVLQRTWRRVVWRRIWRISKAITRLGVYRRRLRNSGSYAVDVGGIRLVLRPYRTPTVNPVYCNFQHPQGFVERIVEVVSQGSCG